MASLFKSIIKKRYEPLGFVVSKVTETKHWNVLRLRDKHNNTYIAKGIIHNDSDKDFSASKMDKAFNTEVKIISSLPKWWGLHLKDTFKQDSFRIIVTAEIPYCKWNSYNGNDKKLAKHILKQLKWLKTHNIAHNDLELKNILLNCDSDRATIIYFEKATIGAYNESDIHTLIKSLSENVSTKGIANELLNMRV